MDRTSKKMFVRCYIYVLPREMCNELVCLTMANDIKINFKGQVTRYDVFVSVLDERPVRHITMERFYSKSIRWIDLYELQLSIIADIVLN